MSPQLQPRLLSSPPKPAHPRLPRCCRLFSPSTLRRRSVCRYFARFPRSIANRHTMKESPRSKYHQTTLPTHITVSADDTSRPPKNGREISANGTDSAPLRQSAERSRSGFQPDTPPTMPSRPQQHLTHAGPGGVFQRLQRLAQRVNRVDERLNLHCPAASRRSAGANGPQRLPTTVISLTTSGVRSTAAAPA